MKNYEKYINEINAIIDSDNGLALKHGKPMPCNGSSCEGCDWYCTGCDCDVAALKWLFAEYEPPKTMSIAELCRRLSFVPNQNKEVRTIKIIDGEIYVNEDWID